MAIIDKKQTRWYSKSTFDSLDKTTIPVGTEIQVAGELGQADFDSDTNTKLNAVPNKLDKPSGNPAEDSVVKVSSTGTVSYEKITKLYAYTLTVTVDMSTEYVITVFSTLEEFTFGQFGNKYGNSVVRCIYRLATASSKTCGQLHWFSGDLHLELEDGTAKIIGNITTDSKVEI